MKHLMEDVRAFHEAAGHPIRSKPAMVPRSRLLLRANLIGEEYFEMLEAMFLLSPETRIRLEDMRQELNGLLKAHAEAPSPLDTKALAGTADALVDMAYFIVGTALERGLPLDKVWEAVQTANMAKFPGGVALRREDGKIIKPEGWQPPDVAAIIAGTK